MIVTIADIETTVCAKFRVTKAQMRSVSRARHIARPRQIIMYLAREMTTRSFPQIATFYGRDHTTVMHGTKRIRSLCQTDPELAAQVAECRLGVQPWKAEIAMRMAAEREAELKAAACPICCPDIGERVEGSG